MYRRLLIYIVNDKTCIDDYRLLIYSKRLLIYSKRLVIFCYRFLLLLRFFLIFCYRNRMTFSGGTFIVSTTHPLVLRVQIMCLLLHLMCLPLQLYLQLQMRRILYTVLSFFLIFCYSRLTLTSTSERLPD